MGCGGKKTPYGRYGGGQSDLDGPLLQLANLLRLAFVPLALVALANGALLSLAGVIVGAAFALAPNAVEWTRKASLSGVVHLAAVALPVADLTGRTLDLYEGSPLPYDLFSHGVGVASATAMVLLFCAAALQSLGWRRRPLVVVTTGGLIGLALAVGWELVEAIAEPLFSRTLQHGFDDTILDVLAGVSGALAASLLVFVYWRADRSSSA